jgi:hypothetical protein
LAISTITMPWISPAGLNLNSLLLFALLEKLLNGARFLSLGLLAFDEGAAVPLASTVVTDEFDSWRLAPGRFTAENNLMRGDADAGLSGAEGPLGVILSGRVVGSSAGDVCGDELESYSSSPSSSELSPSSSNSPASSPEPRVPIPRVYMQSTGCYVSAR